MTEPHAAMRARFMAYRSGLLDADAAQQVRDHLRACAGCRTAFAPFAESSSEEEDGRIGHLPLALLARWDAGLAALPEAERALLEAHRSECAQCAQGVEFSRRMRLVPARPRPRNRAGFLAAGTAALVATLLVVVLRDSPRDPVPVPSAAGVRSATEAAPLDIPDRTPGTTPTPASTAAQARPRRAAVVQLGRATRGDAGQRVRVPAGTTVVPLRVPPLLGVRPEARIRIDVTGPGGGAYGHAEIEHRRLFGEAAPPAVNAVAPDGEALPAGHYDVSAVSDAADPDVPGQLERADYGFDLEWLAAPPAAP